MNQTIGRPNNQPTVPGRTAVTAHLTRRQRIGERPPRLLLLLLTGLCIAAFFTGSRFLPALANNVGPFEVVSLLLLFAVTLYFNKYRLPLRFHPVISLIAVMIFMGGLTLPRLADRWLFGITQLFGLVLLFAFLLAVYNVMLLYPSLLRHLVRSLGWGAALAAVLIIADSLALGGSVGAAGPMRGRAHVGIYFLSAFWAILIYLVWPGISARERWFFVAVLMAVIFVISTSGRRSVYLSFAAGLAGLAFVPLFTKGRDGLHLVLLLFISGAAIWFIYFQASQYWPQAAFFRERVGLIGSRLEMAAGIEEDENSFFALQQRGARRAVQDYPLLGIGWGGFPQSPYSFTGHEMHSTPLRFLAELGVIGFMVYLAFIGYLLFGSIRLLRQARGSPYHLVAFIFVVAWWSLSISYAYNRHITERTFWLLLVIFLGFEALVRQIPRPQPNRNPLALAHQLSLRRRAAPRNE